MSNFTIIDTMPSCKPLIKHYYSFKNNAIGELVFGDISELVMLEIKNMLIL